MTLLRTDIERNDRPSDDVKTGEMVLIPGGTFRMGSNDHYPEEAPVHRVSGRRVLDRSHAGDQPAVQAVRESDRSRHLREVRS